MSFDDDWTGYYDGRVYVRTQSSIPAADIVCTFTGAVSGSIFCNHDILVSCQVSGCGKVTISANGSFEDQKVVVLKEVNVPCAPTDTPTPPPAGSAYIGVASQNNQDRSVSANISSSGCSGVDTWRILWGDDEFTNIASPYFGQQAHTYDDWGAFDIALRYRCEHGIQATGDAFVVFEHPTPTPTYTPVIVGAGPLSTATREGGNGSGAGGMPGATPRADPTRRPIPTQDHTCLPAGATVTTKSPWIHACEVDAAGVGVQWIIDAGYISAIDVWSPLAVDAEVCFAGTGSLLLLDAAFAPRTVLPWPSYAWAGKTCARLDRAGTLLLMPGAPTFVLTATATRSPTATATLAWDPYMIADSLESMISLENCHVSSLYILNLRELPAGPIMRWFIGMANALARTPNCFQIVDNGELGWISAHYVTTQGRLRLRGDTAIRNCRGDQ